MSYSYKCYSDTKDFMKKFVNAEEGAIIYGIITPWKEVKDTKVEDDSFYLLTLAAVATPIVFVGGGAVVMKNFGSHDAKNISYNLDVKANARGYEQLATMGLKSTKRLS